MVTMVTGTYQLPPPTVTFDVIGQFYFRLFFGVELVLVMIRVGATFRL